VSVANFIPQIWADQLLLNIHKAHVYGNPQVVNTDYEGDIKDFGDTVRISSIGTVTVSAYTRNTDMAAPQVLESAQTILSIDQAQYFNFAVDDLDKAQANVNIMEGAMAEAGYAVADVADQYLAGIAVAGVASANTIGSVASPETNMATASVPYGYLVQMAQLLDQSSVPQEGRWAIIPPWFYAYIRKDPNFLHSTELADILLRLGRLGPAIDTADLGGLEAEMAGKPMGQIAGFTIYMSNNVPNSSGTSYQILGGHKMAWSYAQQVVKVEGYRPQYRFADAVKGLHVYGSKVTRPQALVELVANPT
jgi:hypothetical protein